MLNRIHVFMSKLGDGIVIESCC